MNLQPFENPPIYSIMVAGGFPNRKNNCSRLLLSVVRWLVPCPIANKKCYKCKMVIALSHVGGEVKDQCVLRASMKRDEVGTFPLHFMAVSSNFHDIIVPPNLAL